MNRVMLCAALFLCFFLYQNIYGQEDKAIKPPVIEIAPENRCSPYDRDMYSYPRSIEIKIIDRQGIYNPYTKSYYEDRKDTEVEHIVATSEAHDSGLCARPDEYKAFARDLLNLTLADGDTNREKNDRDFAEWMPPHNRCWYAGRVLAVKAKYRLTMDVAEAEAILTTLAMCDSIAMEY